ncbi:MAG: hypothetical protein OIF47_09000 [Marinibacterium sp.]|nr:hypothetical protein [Marinibacterium sp.]
MSAHQRIPRAQPGAVAVGRLPDLSPWDAALILNTRLWRSGPQGQAQVWSDYALAFGADEGREELKTFEVLLAALDTHGHRPLATHAITCSMVGSDEMILARLTRLGAAGDLREAALMAALIVLPSHAEQVASLAAQVGSALRREFRLNTRHDAPRYVN